MHRDRRLRVDEARVGIEETDLPLEALVRPAHGLVPEHGADDAHVLLQVGELHRPEAHRQPSGEAGPDPEDDASRREAIQRREPVGGDRRDPIRRHEDAGPDLDAARALGRERHGDEDVGTQELRVVEPGVREAELFGAPDGLPGVDAGGEGDAEVHGGILRGGTRTGKGGRREHPDGTC
jgi:hypothetical protein